MNIEIPIPTQHEVDQLLALYKAGHYSELESTAQQLVERFPLYGRAWKILGMALGVQSKNALSAMQKAAQFLPEDASVQNNLGNAWQDLGEFDAAAVSYQRAIEIEPHFAAAHNNMGNALKCLGRINDSLSCYRRALEIEPHYADAHYNLGNALQNLGQLEGAGECFRRALEIEPEFTDAHNIYGTVLLALGRLDAAQASFRRAVALNTEHAMAHNNLGSVLLDVGQFDAAQESFRRALELEPALMETHSNLLFAINCEAKHSSAFCLEKARIYGRIATQHAITPYSAWECNAAPKYLRVGVISGDLRNHPVGYALESLLEQLDTTRVALFAYTSNIPEDDALAMRIQPYFAAWKSIHGHSDAEVAHLIHADGIHILLDLSGHTAHNRLSAFAYKPAPVQVSWLGYFATTGLVEMDYLLTSEVAVPQTQQMHFTERVWYLPDIWLCFTPPESDLPVSVSPALTLGYPTFGCFQRLDKISSETLEVWSRILARLPKARLRIANKQLGSQETAAHFKQCLQQHAIDLSRVHLQGPAASREKYLARYAEVDIMLDTFPYPGVTTTCEALWMGVPTLSLAGDTLMSRQGAGMLVPAGLGEWVTNNKAEYVEKAIQLSGDLHKLATLRVSLRGQVLASPIFNAPRFARNFEAAMWRMWQAWRDKT